MTELAHTRKRHVAKNIRLECKNGITVQQVPSRDENLKMAA
jgi:hypothetical protein